jgi:hypothetical protein
MWMSAVQWQVESMQRAISAWVSVNLLRACGDKFSHGERWKCICGEFRAPTLKTPFLVVASQYDKVAISRDIRNKSAREEIAKETRRVLTSLPSKAAVFSTTCYNNAQSENVHFNVESASAGLGQLSTMNSMLNQTLQAFKAGKDQGFPRLIETCGALHCGSGCLQVELCHREPSLCAPNTWAKPWVARWGYAVHHAACRLDKSDTTTDGRGSAQIGPPGDTLGSCKERCFSQLKSHCHGVEFHTGSGRCEMWSRPVTHTVPVGGFICVAVNGLAKVQV